MSITAWIAVLVIIATIYCLIKRYETRLVLFTAGLFLCCISMKPMAALDQFAKSMTNASLIMAICGAIVIWLACLQLRSRDWAFC